MNQLIKFNHNDKILRSETLDIVYY